MAARETACERRAMRMVVVVSLVAALGCSTSKPATAPMPKSEPAPELSVTDEQFEATRAHEIVMLDAMAAAIDAAGTDCGRMADGLNRVLDDNVSFFAEERRYQANTELNERSAVWRAAHTEQFRHPMRKIGAAMDQCAADAKFTAFWRRFRELDHPIVVPDAEFDAIMAEAIAVFDAMGAAVDAGGEDCGKIGDGLNKALDDYPRFVAEAKRFKADEERRKRGEAWMKVHLDELMGPMMKVGRVAQTCAADPSFAAFQKRFGEL